MPSHNRVHPFSESIQVSDKFDNDHVVIEVKEVEQKPVEAIERDKWSHKAEFLLSCIGYAVGLGNVWRFPYLVFKNGGATFLIPYVLTLVVCGIPMFYLELALGQYMSLGPTGAWASLCPLLQGIGVAMVLISALISIYYNVVIAWSFFYLYESLTSQLPWATCGNEWNTPLCRDRIKNESLNCTDKPCTSPTQEFWTRYVLHQSEGIDSPGDVRVPLAVTLLLAWVVVYLCISKGIKSSGKVAYCSAVFPYILLLVLLIRGATLEGASDGILFYLTPNFSRLLEPTVWIDAASQIYFSLSVGIGGLIVFGSYNNFHNNCERDAIIISLINCATSFFAGFVIFCMLGFMAHAQNVPVEKVISSGPGLGFVAYPEGIAQMPLSPLWAALFFFTLFLLGLDSQFVFAETIVCSITDRFSGLRAYKTYVALSLCAVCFLGGLSCVTEGGIYVFEILNSQAGGISLLFISLFETIAIGWVYGADRFCSNIESMIKKKPHVYFVICWKYVSPLVSVVILVWGVVQWEGMTYGEYRYPDWANVTAWIVALSSITAIPAYALYHIFWPSGSFRQRLRNAVTPNLSLLNEIEKRNSVMVGGSHSTTKATPSRTSSRSSATVIDINQAKQEGQAPRQESIHMPEPQEKVPGRNELQGQRRRQAPNINWGLRPWLQGGLVAPTWSWSWTSTDMSPYQMSVSLQNSPRALDQNQPERLRDAFRMVRSKSAPGKLNTVHTTWFGNLPETEV